MTRAEKDRDDVAVTGTGRKSVVTVSLDDDRSRREAACLLRSPANARRLMMAIERLENGGGTLHEFVE
ncbi:type II toxin-antitoxin system Phd/YefM family antitoxin [Sphaerimonospora thailandensis]|uniref:type II toxin-antitoxin system prevent-host-death family antitoxin n=1 Tax=Sphaerimonospora thailandensis TaxID=795644 RepID=UPI00194DBF4F|nr:type II toxin-antitoxin system prevent-host-death family antitoxin [Sphaerimonospora thailandensis]